MCAVELFTRFLSQSKHAKLLGQASLQQAYKDYPSGLSEIILQLSHFFSGIVLPHLAEITDESVLLRLADLTLAVTGNHEIALIDSSEVSDSLFEAVFAFMR